MATKIDPIRMRLKDILHDSERLDRYYTRSSEHNLWWHRTWLFALLGSTFFIGIVDTIPGITNGSSPEIVANGAGQVSPWISLFLLIVVAVSSVIMLVWDFSHKAGVYKIVGEQCRDIARECIQLWHQDPLPEYAEGMISEFEIRITNVTKEVIKIDEKLNEQCDEEAEQSVARLQLQT